MMRRGPVGLAAAAGRWGWTMGVCAGQRASAQAAGGPSSHIVEVRSIYKPYTTTVRRYGSDLASLIRHLAAAWRCGCGRMRRPMQCGRLPPPRRPSGTTRSP
jgi:glycine/D-amino acid oxidase-like deaminating enzyme